MRRSQNFKLIEWNQHNYLLMALIVSTKAQIIDAQQLKTHSTHNHLQKNNQIPMTHSIKQIVHLLLSQRLRTIFIANHNPDMNCQPAFTAQLIMPSVYKLFLSNVHQVVQQFRVLQIEVFCVLSDYDHVMTSVVVVDVGSWVAGGFEILQQCDHWLAIVHQIYQLIESHVFFAYELQFSLQPTLGDQFVKSILQHHWSSSFVRDCTCCSHYFRLSDFKREVVQHRLHGNRPTGIASRLYNIWNVHQFQNSVWSIDIISPWRSCEISVQKLRQGRRKHVFRQYVYQEKSHHQDLQNSLIHLIKLYSYLVS